MKSALRWIVSLLGPLILVLIIFVSYVVGTCLHSVRTSRHLRAELTSSGVRPATLAALAPLFESERNSATWRTVIKLAELAELVELGKRTEFAERLSSKRSIAQIRLTSSELSHLQTLATTPESPSAEINETLLNLVVGLLSPNPGRLERAVYSKLREMFPFAAERLPQLPQPISIGKKEPVK
jgi:hypothetical protein